MHQRSELGARLALFAGACRAVQFAHDRYIVHRDLKPSNILVTAEGLVKLVDFGIAKSLDDHAGSNPDQAAHVGQTAMTPEYASPEQLRGETLTPASDVYSLGMVLYELLTGRRPYVARGRSLMEFERVVSQYVPVPPSRAIVARLGGAAVNGAKAPAKLRLPRSLTNDIDAVVLKALKKEPADRHPTARELLDDIKRLQSSLPTPVQRWTVIRRIAELSLSALLIVALATGWLPISELLKGLAENLVFWGVLILFGLGVIYRADRKAAHAIRLLLLRYDHARALVLNTWNTNSTDEGDPILGLLLQVQPGVGDSFEAETRLSVPNSELHSIQAGDMVRVRYTRRRNVTVIPEWESGRSARSADSATESARRIA